MSAVLENKPVAAERLTEKLAFYTRLQTVTNAIHSTGHVDEILLELSSEICSLFNAERLTIYIVVDEAKGIVTKVKTGLNSFKQFRLPVSEHSIAGYAALHKRLINIRDVYDEAELGTYSPKLHFLNQVDAKTG